VVVRVTHFPLHPETPESGLALAELSKGREEMWQEMRRRLEVAMAEEGLAYGERTMTYNSRLAQELAAWAVEQPRGVAIHDRLFRAYFAEGQNIGDPAILLDLAESVGLSRDEAGVALEERAYREAVDRDWARSRQVGVTGVPTYVASGLSVVGAQPYEVIEELVKRAGAERRAR
jgi:predicted DsbA family dithiol-disulfide isomerase